MTTKSTYFKVELNVLQQLSGQLEEAEDCMSSALTAMQQDSSGGIGTPELDQACAHFKQSWAYGLQQMQKSSKNLFDGLTATSKNYEQVESALAAEMKKFGQALPGGGS